MLKIKLYFNYFISTILINITSSVFFAYILKLLISSIFKSDTPFFNIYLFCITYGGPLFAFYYKEVTYKNEYYFYYNKGIRKDVLIAFTALLYILTGNFLLLIATYFTEYA